MTSIKMKSVLFFVVSSLLVLSAASAEDRDPNIWKGLFQPLPAQAESSIDPVTAEKIALGKKLFSDPVLSKDRDISCASCHSLETYGVDNNKTSTGHKGQVGTRNSPTVYNAALHFSQFWDGRAVDVEAQALGPVLNPVEMAMEADSQVLERLKDDPTYVKSFAAAFPENSEQITFVNMGKAIGAFERTLLTPSKFDDFLNGNKEALTDKELSGLRTFRDVGCVSCHNGVAVGGQMFQKLGLVKAFATKDLGRYEVTKNEADKFVFKVPSLRNVAKTAPYFHDGSIESLDQAVKLMGEHQLGRELAPEQIAEIVAFLGSLTGRLPQ